MDNPEQGSTPAVEAAPVDARSLAERIARSGPDMGIELPKSAPESDNTNRKVSSDERQPEPKGQEPKAPEQPEGQKKTDVPPAPEPDSQKTAQPESVKQAEPDKAQKPVPEATPDPAKAEADELAQIRVRMGLKPSEPETIETWKKRHSESSREAHRLVELDKIKNQLLSEIDLKFIKKGDGSYGLMADETKVADKLKDVAPKVLSSLTEDEKGLVDEKVANKLVEQTIAALSVKSPRSTATVEDVVMPDGELQTIFNSLTGEKLPDGQPVYHGLNDQTFVDLMQEVYSADGLEPFRKLANKSPENMREFLKLVHGSVYRGYAATLARKADQEAQRKLKEKEQLKEPSPSPSGRSPVDTKTDRVPTAQDLAKRIASAA